MHGVEPLRVTRHQNQQRIGMHLQQAAVRLEYLRILAFMGAGCDPDRALAGLPLLAQLAGTGQQMFVELEVELDRAGHLHAFGSST
ncbi:hypothetical protein D3C84_1228050 [compost metagenome]